MEAPICVVDASSLIHISAIEFGPYKLIDLLDAHFNLVVPKYIIDEEVTKKRPRITGIYGEDAWNNIQEFIDKGYPNIYEHQYGGCLEISKKWIEHGLRYSTVGRIINKTPDDGEIHCLAVALHLSKKSNHFPIFLSDDYSGIQNQGLRSFINHQCIGTIFTTQDFILYLYSRLDWVTQKIVFAAFKQLKEGMTLKKWKASIYMDFDARLEFFHRKIETDEGYTFCEKVCSA